MISRTFTDMVAVSDWTPRKSIAYTEKLNFLSSQALYSGRAMVELEMYNEEPNLARKMVHLYCAESSSHVCALLAVCVTTGPV